MPPPVQHVTVWRMDSKLEGSEDSWSETRLSDSPPEAERLLVHDGFVYWSSKQSITRISTDGGTYEMVAPNTTVGAMHVQEDTFGGQIRKVVDCLHCHYNRKSYIFY